MLAISLWVVYPVIVFWRYQFYKPVNVPTASANLLSIIDLLSATGSRLPATIREGTVIPYRVGISSRDSI